MAEPIAKTFRYCPSCGVKANEVGASPFRCGACEYVLYFSPTCAVAGIITNGHGEFLFLIRARDPGMGQFGLPGGFADPGETLEAATVREVREETSLSVTDIEYLCSFPNWYTYRGVVISVLDAFFVCKVKSFDSLKAQPGEVDGFRVAHPTHEILSNMAFESNRRAVEYFLEREADGVRNDIRNSEQG